MINWFLVSVLKLLGFLSRKFGLGAGSTWPGHIMLSVNPHFLKEFGKSYQGKIIVVAGTNGKTTTSTMIGAILEKERKSVLHNKSGANLLNGIASSIINAALLDGKLPDIAIFEVDENTLSLLLNEFIPDILVVLNLFRDQLDRYGEVNTIALRWKKALEQLPKKTTVLLNADDPHIAYLAQGLEAETKFFGIEDSTLYLATRPHAMDALYCPQCNKPLSFDGIYLGHLGIWKCTSCGLKRPKISYKELKALPGVYNIYNTQAALLVAQALGVKEENIDKALRQFVPAFGRQEEFDINGKKIKIFLSKNPTGFNESLRTVKELGAKNLLLVLNDRIPDGRDVSWIWDVDFEEFIDNTVGLTVSGDRCFDMALRLKYAEKKCNTCEDLKEAVEKAISEGNEMLYILATYSAMLEVRKILGGRKIL